MNKQMINKLKLSINTRDNNSKHLLSPHFELGTPLAIYMYDVIKSSLPTNYSSTIAVTQMKKLGSREVQQCA